MNPTSYAPSAIPLTSFKPFNLEAALAGKPVVNRSGKPRFITKIAIPRPSGEVILVQDEHGELMSYNNADGKNHPGTGSWSNFDLFMAPTTVTKWINLYLGYNVENNRFTAYDSEEQADTLAIKSERIGGKAHKVTWEV